jgi:hypothetical protein
MMKTWTKLLALSYGLLLPCLSYADFKLSEFAGNYIAYSSSAGGVTTPNPSNVSTTSVLQFKINRHGSGTINFLSVTNFAGVGSSIANTYSDLNLQFSLINPCLGIGTLTVLDYPIVGSNLDTSFVATKGTSRFGKQRNCVEKIFANITGSSGTTPFPIRNVSVVLAERQRQ